MTIARWGYFEMSEPDKFSHAYYEREFRGVNHGLNLCLAEHDEFTGAIKRLDGNVEKLVAAVREAREEIGKQAAEIAELKEAMEKARAAFRELRELIDEPERKPTSTAESQS